MLTPTTSYFLPWQMTIILPSCRGRASQRTTSSATFPQPLVIVAHLPPLLGFSWTISVQPSTNDLKHIVVMPCPNKPSEKFATSSFPIPPGLISLPEQVIQQATGQQVSQPVAQIVAGFAKVFVGEIVEKGEPSYSPSFLSHQPL
jgi:hypothetical protein